MDEHRVGHERGVLADLGQVGRGLAAQAHAVFGGGDLWLVKHFDGDAGLGIVGRFDQQRSNQHPLANATPPGALASCLSCLKSRKAGRR